MPRKKTYTVQNWTEYSKALVNRGSLTVWFDQDSIDSWFNTMQTGKRGRPQLYSDLAIQCCLTLKTVFKLPLRATQGFVDSLLRLLNLPLSAPDYSLLSIRQKTLELQLPNHISSSDSIHLVVDATGLKLYGEGEWKVKKHGKEKRRTWLKLHLAIDEKSQAIEASLLTADNVHDCEALPELLDQVNSTVSKVTGDGAYDTHDAYQAAINKGATPCFPPRKNAVRHRPDDEGWISRNHAVSDVIYHSLKYWKKKNDYHRRSLAETAMFRFKQLLGSQVDARSIERQSREIGIKCLILNKMTHLGMPDSKII